MNENDAKEKRAVMRERRYAALEHAIRSVAEISLTPAATERVRSLLEQLRRELGLKSARGRPRSVNRREVVALRLRGMTYAEIARRVGCTPSAVKLICIEELQ